MGAAAPEPLPPPPTSYAYVDKFCFTNFLKTLMWTITPITPITSTLVLHSLVDFEYLLTTVFAMVVKP